MGVGGAFLCFLSCPLTIVFTTKITHLPVNGSLSSVTSKFLWILRALSGAWNEGKGVHYPGSGQRDRSPTCLCWALRLSVHGLGEKWHVAGHTETSQVTRPQICRSVCEARGSAAPQALALQAFLQLQTHQALALSRGRASSRGAREAEAWSLQMGNLQTFCGHRCCGHGFAVSGATSVTAEVRGVGSLAGSCLLPRISAHTPCGSGHRVLSAVSLGPQTNPFCDLTALCLRFWVYKMDT